MCHNRLGCPATSIFRTIMFNCNVLNSNKRNHLFAQLAALEKFKIFLFLHHLMNILLLYISLTQMWGPHPFPALMAIDITYISLMITLNLHGCIY